MKSLLLALLLIVTSSCTKVAPANSERVSQLVEQRTGKKAYWFQNSQEDQLIEENTALLLQHPLSLDAVIHISLLHNRSLQATFEELGISRADLVQAGLFHNPLISAVVRFPARNSAHLNTEFSIVQNFLDVFTIPLRQKYAKAQFEQTELRVANTIVQHVATVKSTYYQLQTEVEMATDLRILIDIATVAAELSERQQEAGNSYETTVLEHKKRLFSTQTVLNRAETRIIHLRGALNQLMGLFGTQSNWNIIDHLPDIPEQELSLDDLESIAIKNRLDLMVAKKEIELMSHALGLEQWWTRFQGQIGISSQKDLNEPNAVGPLLEMELPIFNYGQADRARLRSKLQQSCHQMMALSASIQAEVRATKEMFIVSRQLVEHFRDFLLPMQAQLVQLSQRLYNVMNISTDSLLTSKREQIEAHIEYLMSLKDYWLVRTELLYKIGNTGTR